MSRFLIGSTLREVKNARLNCNNPDNEVFKSSTDNATYVKKIRKGNQTFPYASAQWQKKAIKGYAESQGHRISPVISESTKKAYSDGNPFLNYDEDVMGFMIARNAVITEEEYAQLSEEEQKEWKKSGKEGYKRDVTVKRRANLMLSTLQAIGHTRIMDEFSSKETNETPIPYSKEVYAADMSSSFVLDICNIGVFTVGDNASAYRDYTNYSAKKCGLTVSEGNIIELEREEKLRRIKDTLKGIQYLPTRITMTNNLEDMSAKFIIFAEYSIGNSIFNNIFEDGKLKLEYLKEAISENEEYRKSKIFIGVRSEYFKQNIGENEFKYLREILEEEFGSDDRFVIGDVSSVIEEYNKNLEV